MADLYVCSHGKTNPCDQCAEASQIAKMLALRKQLDPDAPDVVVFPDPSSKETAPIADEVWAAASEITQRINMGEHNDPALANETALTWWLATVIGKHITVEERLLFASDVSRNQQHRINELERIVRLLLGYVDHRGVCTSYTNGPCTCGFESAMHDPAIAYNNSRRLVAEKFKGQFGKLG